LESGSSGEPLESLWIMYTYQVVKFERGFSLLKRQQHYYYIDWDFQASGT